MKSTRNTVEPRYSGPAGECEIVLINGVSSFQELARKTRADSMHTCVYGAWICECVYSCMASQPPSESVMFEIDSFVRGYHPYMTVWEPRVGEVLVLQGEPHNPKDQLAVLVEVQLPGTCLSIWLPYFLTS